MADDQGRIREIGWLEIFPWLRLIRALRLAFAPRMLILAALGIAATNAGWGVIGLGFTGSTDESVIKAREAIERWRQASIVLADAPEVSLRVMDPAETPARIPWQLLSGAFSALYEWEVSAASFIYLLLCGLWALVVWSLFGAAISRSAAVWFAREDKLGFRRSLGWGVAKWPAYFGAVLWPQLGVLLAFVPIAIMGVVLLKAGGFLTLLAGIFWFVALLCALFVAILLVGLLFGWPLMWPTISVEGTDSFDAMSRAYSYTYQRPLHYLFYAVVAGVLGTLGWIVVLIFYAGVTNYSYWGASWGGGVEEVRTIQNTIDQLNLADREAADGDETAAEGRRQRLVDNHGRLFVAGARAVRFWIYVVQYLSIGFLFSYFWCAATFIYFLLRQSVDATEMDEVAVEEEAEAYGLPPMDELPAGPPQVNDTPPSAPA